MKAITLLTALWISPSLYAMEQPELSGNEQPPRIISSIYQMTGEQLVEFSRNLTTLFSQLENNG